MEMKCNDMQRYLITVRAYHPAPEEIYAVTELVVTVLSIQTPEKILHPWLRSDNHRSSAGAPNRRSCSIHN